MTTAAAPAPCLLDDPLASHAALRPDAVASVCGETRWTWRQLLGRVELVAGALAASGVGHGDRVAWLAQNCHRYLETMLACGRLGAVFTPLNWRLSAGELAFVLSDCDPRVVFWQRPEIDAWVVAARAATTLAAEWVELDTDDTASDGTFSRWIRREPSATGTRPPATDPALMLYSGLSDGRPVGVYLSHTGLLTQAWYGVAFGGASGSDVYLNSGPLFHVGTLKTTLATYAAGGTNVFVARAQARLLCQVIARERCTGAFLQPVTIEQLVAENADHRYDLSSLRAKPGPVAWNEMVSPAGSGRYRSGYGQTELGGVVTFIDSQRAALGQAGFPAPLLRLAALSPDGAPLGPGEIGELAVRGPVVAAGYHRRPEVTARRQAQGWHHTTDLGRLETDGSVTFIGPMTQLIKSGAENIYPAEVEACLRTHPAVRDVGVLGVPDPVWGQAVTAVVVAVDPVTAEVLVAHCRQHLASYKKPRRVLFAAALPRRDGGLDRAALDRAFGGGGYPGTGPPNGSTGPGPR
jgi:long-chain acyl-CoA synthetase